MINFTKTRDIQEPFDGGFAFSNIQVDFEKDTKKTSLDKDSSLTYSTYPRVFYQIGIYKKPGTLVLTQYLPMFVLSWVLLAIFKGQQDLNARIANISVLVLAYIAFIPSLR